jgi:hypothetical protein
MIDGRSEKGQRERESHPETTRHTIDPLFKPVKARLSRIGYPFFLTFFDLSLSLYLYLYLSERDGEREMKKERDQRCRVRRSR